MPCVFDGEGVELNAVVRKEHVGYRRVNVQGPVPRLQTVRAHSAQSNSSKAQ